jgi:two-component system nitrogen regulation sensor histidine kinase NtrY
MTEPEEEKRRRRNRRLILAGFILFLAILISVEYFLHRSTGSEAVDITNPFLLYAILNINITLVFVILFVLLRDIIKLYLERKKGVLGSKFKTKLVIAFIGFSLIPTIIIFVGASNLILTSVDRSFSAPVNIITDTSLKIADEFYREREELALGFARELSRYITAEGLLPKRFWLEEKLAKPKIAEYHLDLLEIYEGEERLFPSYVNPRLPLALLDDIPPTYMAKLISGDDFSLRSPLGKGMLIRTGVPILSHEGKAVGSVVVGYFVDPVWAFTSERIKNYYENYNQAKAHRGYIKAYFLLLILMITLLIIFSAVWLGLRMSKGITIPIQKLAEGTRAVSAGNMDYKVDVEVEDEVGILVKSFNRMTAELKQSKDGLERSNVELKRMTGELIARKQYIEALLETITAGVISLDKRGRITTINQAAKSILGLNDKEGVGNLFSELFPGERYHHLLKLIEEGKKKGEGGISRQLSLETDEGSKRLSVNLTTLKEKDGRSLGMVLVIDDLTHLIKAQKVAAWREVARRIAHEIKNPLTPIQLSAQRLRKKFKGREDEEARLIEDCTRTIMNEATTLKLLVGEFSRFARMPEVDLRLSSLNRILKQIVTLYQEANGRVDFKLALERRIPRIPLDEEQMKRVLINIIDNAIEAMNGEGKVTINTSYNKDTKRVELSVADTGPGIKPEDKDKLFLPYFSTKAKGTGLGLAIVDRIVSDHHGYIRVRDNKPRGAVFIIELPRG